MNWFLVALIPPALWAVTNFIDKYLTGHYFKGRTAAAPLVFTGITALIYTTVLVIIKPQVMHVGLPTAVVAAVSGASYIFGLIPYYYALQRDEASRVMPLFQLEPVLIYVLALIFLGEVLSLRQIAGSVLIICGGILLTLDMDGGRFRIRKPVLALVLLSSLLLTLNPLLFKAISTDADFWTISYWSYMGIILAAASLFVGVRPYRRAILSFVRRRQLAPLYLTAFTESISITARLTYWFASTLVPVALVQTVASTQPLFVFILGVALTLFAPRYGRESLARAHLAQKLASIMVILGGSYLLLS